MSRLEFRQLGSGFALWAVGDELAAKVRQPCPSSIPLNQPRNALPSVAVAFCAANLKQMKGAFKFTESA